LVSLGFLVGLDVRCLQLALEDCNYVLKMIHSLSPKGVEQMLQLPTQKKVHILCISVLYLCLIIPLVNVNFLTCVQKTSYRTSYWRYELVSMFIESLGICLLKKFKSVAI